MLKEAVLEETLSQLETPADMDSPWKNILEVYFRSFMEICLPTIAQEINWLRGYESLDKELQKLTKQSEAGRRIVDKLMKVYTLNGEEAWILLHIEVQGQQETDFPKRMLIYRYRIWDRHQKPIISVAILTDDSPNWRPDYYEENCYGTSLAIQYRVIKILDFADREKELAERNDPFSMVILAQLAVLKTRKDPESRYYTKTALTRQLFQKNWSKDDIQQLFLLIDWLIALPEKYVIKYQKELTQIEEEKKMNYISTPERVGMAKGIIQGRQEGIQQGVQQGELLIFSMLLQHRFGEIPATYLALMQQADAETLLSWSKKSLDAKSLEEIFNV